jgi:leader peptidase (prepilin peptidase)/N-methyltransferase
MGRVWTPTWIAIAAAVGAVAGHFVRALVFGHSVSAGTPWRHRCPACDTEIVAPGWRPTGLPPTGRCPSCRAKIGPPPGSVELVTAIVLAALAWRIGVHPSLVAFAWAAVFGVALAFVDVAVHRLPDRLIAAAVIGTTVIFGIAVAAGAPYHRLVVSVLCGLGAGVAYFLVVFLSPSGMGLGDAKLAVLVGLTTGWFGIGAALYGLFAGLLFAGLTALVLLALRRVTRHDNIAHGPFMVLGALAAILFLHV